MIHRDRVRARRERTTGGEKGKKESDLARLPLKFELKLNPELKAMICIHALYKLKSILPKRVSYMTPRFDHYRKVCPWPSLVFAFSEQWQLKLLT